MKADGRDFTSIWLKDKDTVQIIDQRKLPYELVIDDLRNVDDVVTAIKDMHLRGAPLIGVAAAYGMYLAVLNHEDVNEAAERLKAARPTAVNLSWAVDRMLKSTGNSQDKIKTALETANKIRDESIDECKKIGEYGYKLIEDISKKKNGEPVNILTHCNAGWLACVDYGTATSPIYMAHNNNIRVHVWVDETRPRNQGARLTAWELGKQGVPYTVIVDNAGGHLMQHGKVDMVLVGADRVSRNGDAANKIGTYLKALAAKDNNIPFYVAIPSSTIDWDIRDGIKEITIEERNENEVKYIEGKDNGLTKKVLLTLKESKAVNYGFDVTPARLLTGFITERGICKPAEEDILRLFPEKK